MLIETITLIFVIFILWCITNYKWFADKYQELIKKRLYQGEKEIERINKITNYKGGLNG